MRESSEGGNLLVVAEQLELGSVCHEVINDDVGVLRATGHLCIVTEEFDTSYGRSVE